jgi:predicted metal-dependent peptidase
VTQTVDPFAEIEKIAKRKRLEIDAKKRVETARTKLVLDSDPNRCFFKCVSMGLDCEQSWDVETASTNGRRIRYNPEYIMSMTEAETMGVLCGHEPLHCCFGHHARRGNRDPKRYNIAADLTVNQICKAAGFALPTCALTPGVGEYVDFPPDLSVEQYYNLLPEDAGQGDGDDPGGCGGVEDAASDAAGNEQSAQQWERNAAQAAEMTAKQKGELPGVLSKLIENIMHPAVPWQSVLQDFVSRTFEAKDDYSWMFPNRHYMAMGICVPGLRSQGIGHVVVAIDTSGSLDDDMLQVFAGELNGVLDARPCKVSVLYCDRRIHKVVDWVPVDGPLKLEAVGRGGTSHKPIFDYVTAHEDEPVCVVCMTDLETDTPTNPLGIPTLWVVPKDCTQQAPFGQIVRLDK